MINNSTASSNDGQAVMSQQIFRKPETAIKKRRRARTKLKRIGRTEIDGNNKQLSFDMKKAYNKNGVKVDSKSSANFTKCFSQ